MGEKSQPRSSSSSAASEVCIPSCKKRNKQLDMVRCCLCMVWYHVECVHETDTKGVWNCTTCRTLPSLVQRLVDSLSSLKEELSTLSGECQQLRTENAALRGELLTMHSTQHSEVTQKLSALESRLSDESDTVRTKDSSSVMLPEVVRATVQSAIHEDQHRKEVIISKAEDKGQDETFITELCSKLNFKTRPTEVRRLGKKNATSRPRPLKVSFSCPFDSRAFRSRVDEVRRTDKEVAALRVRPGRSKEEQILFKKNADIVHKLNNDAKKDQSNISFSLRDNGTIWKFEKKDVGGWVRVQDWTLPDSGN